MITTFGYAQEKNSDQLTSDLQNWQLVDQQQVFLNQENAATSLQANLNKTVLIRQVGETNTAFLNVFSDSYSIEVIQTGDYNTVDVNETALQISKNIIQTGDHNTYFENSFTSGEHTMMHLNQEGDNLYFEKFGSNALSDKIKLKMTGNSKTILLRNF